ncbi:hypothetical protein CEXT_560151 [Caerostris extrusa]|uniref:Uncharacterized protein n=1 Tax=Caerostris extrusa TaxID=172846 RepID=A0AAV4X3M3_CAEEX|nr:hypothetical protein CEXT_560151 [Caerostris extrusa]
MEFYRGVPTIFTTSFNSMRIYRFNLSVPIIDTESLVFMSQTKHTWFRNTIFYPPGQLMDMQNIELRTEGALLIRNFSCVCLYEYKNNSLFGMSFRWSQEIRKKIVNFPEGVLRMLHVRYLDFSKRTVSAFRCSSTTGNSLETNAKGQQMQRLALIRWREQYLELIKKRWCIYRSTLESIDRYGNTNCICGSIQCSLPNAYVCETEFCSTKINDFPPLSI